jgi:hypothetical protein
MKDESKEKNIEELDSEEIHNVKKQILFYFSDALQNDESLSASMKKRQIIRCLLNWANENK